MRILGEYFCNVCAAEIPSGEDNNEFTTTLLAAKGHAHSECLGQKNAVIEQYDEMYQALNDLLSPDVPSSQKVAQAGQVESKRPGVLKRVKPRGPKPRKLPRGVSLGKMPRSKKGLKVRRGS